MQFIRITNTTRATTLAERCGVANTFWTRLRGLMGRSALEPGSGLLIFPEWSIHTFFMRFPIDVLFLDRSNRVLTLHTAMPPNRPYAGAWGGYAVLELPAGSIAASQTSTGDVIGMEPAPYPSEPASSQTHASDT